MNMFQTPFFSSSVLGSHATQAAPLGSLYAVSSHSLGITIAADAGGTARDFVAKLMYVRFAAAVAGTGYPCAFVNDATYGNHCVTATYAAALVYSMVGISIYAVPTAGHFGFVQVGGPNLYVITGAAAVAADAIVYWSATNQVTAAAADANRVMRLGVNKVAIGAGGPLAVGTVVISPCGLGGY